MGKLKLAIIRPVDTDRIIELENIKEVVGQPGLFFEYPRNIQKNGNSEMRKYYKLDENCRIVGDYGYWESLNVFEVASNCPLCDLLTDTEQKELCLKIENLYERITEKTVFEIKRMYLNTEITYRIILNKSEGKKITEIVISNVISSKK